MNALEIDAKLQILRQQALANGEDTLGSHQLDAHWSMAYACCQPPEAWEVYRIPDLHLMPSTDFYIQHAAEIKDALTPSSTWKLLQEHAVPKLALADQMTKQECVSHGYPGKVQFYDHKMGRWNSIDVPTVRWFDSRDLLRESLLEAKDDLQKRIMRNLSRYREAAAKDPTAKRLEALAKYEKFVRKEFPNRLSRFDAGKIETRYWLSKLDQTPDFSKTLFTLVRRAENQVRQSHGIANVGEAWVSETELLYRVRKIFPNIEVTAHGQPKWIGRQHLDIWIPSLDAAIEYHGIQHFRPVAFFGGESSFQRGQERDKRKRNLCEQHRVRLIEVAYDNDISDVELERLIKG